MVMRAHKALFFFILFVLLAVVATTAAMAITGPHAWSQRFGCPTYDSDPFSIAVDPGNNMIITGYFVGTVDFGGGDLVCSDYWGDGFLAKFDASGDYQWSMRFGDSLEQYGRRLATDADGNILVAGDFNGTVCFGGDTLTSLGNYDIFLAKLDADGGHIWSKRFGSAGFDRACGLGTDSSGNVYLTGFFLGTIDFGGGGMTDAGSYDIFLAKFDADGNHVWSQRFGNTLDDVAVDLAVASTGDVLITGDFTSTSINFGGGTLTNAGSYDIYIARFSTSGAHQWSMRFGDTGIQRGISVDTDGSDNVILATYFSGTVNFGGGVLTSAGSNDIGLAKFTSGGGHVWSKRFGDSGGQEPACVRFDSEDRVVLSGTYTSPVDFGGGALAHAGGSDVFVARFTSAGNHLWSEGYGDTDYEHPSGLAVDALDNVVTTGGFYGTIDFGGGPLTSAGGSDIFLAKFRFSQEPIIMGIEDIGNDQGRQVRINFISSVEDEAGASTPILQYEAYRRIDPLPAVAPENRRDVGEAVMRSDAVALLKGWEFVGAIPAHAELEYNIVTPTLADSTITDGMHYSVFMIRAATGSPAVYYDALPDSGYSVDNLAPFVPSSFVVAYNTGSGNELSWDDPVDEDFQYFAVYRGTSPDFTPGDGNRVHMTTGTSWNDPEYDGWPVYYRVTAVDFSGNESAPATAGTVTGIDVDAPTAANELFQNVPNPFNPTTTITFTLRETGDVTLSVYDARGRHVRALVRDRRDARRYDVTWDGRDDAGARVASGVYFYRLVAGSFTQTRKMVLLK